MCKLRSRGILENPTYNSCILLAAPKGVPSLDKNAPGVPIQYFRLPQNDTVLLLKTPLKVTGATREIEE